MARWWETWALIAVVILIVVVGWVMLQPITSSIYLHAAPLDLHGR